MAARRRILGAAGVALAALVAAVAPAGAQTQTGGTSPTELAPASRAVPTEPAVTANAYGRPAPRVRRVACRAACADGGAARPGSLVRVHGRGLRKVDEVHFLGADADGADDASVAPRATRRRAVLVRVPQTALTGRIAVSRPDGTRSAASRRPVTVQPLPLTPPAGVIDAEAQRHKVFFGSARPAELSYVVGGAQPADVSIELIRAADGAAVGRWSAEDVAPGVPQTVEWDGTASGKVQRDGVYQFRAAATDATGARAVSSARATAQDDAPGAFTFLGHRFPIAGRHGYGEFQAGFGGGRGHQGQDVFAACGTPLVAARGGVVKFKQYHARAGHYIVIDGARTGTDFAYMHMREAALVDKGDRVKTGQLIGYVGDTGRASGCHLHFEQWSAPGWYTGGKPFDPLPDLRAWDAQS